MLAPLLGVKALTGAPEDVLWMWSGAVTPTGATIKALARAAGLPLRLVLTPADQASAAPVVEQSATAGPRGVAAFVVTHLEPATTYRYTVEGPSGRTLGGQLKTFAEGHFSFRLGFASCAKTGSSSLVFEAIRLQHPDLFIHLGDLHYEDIVLNDVARFGQAYTKVLTSRTQGDFFRHVPVAYAWDDHDFGPNDSDRTSPSRRAAHEAYRLYVPHYPLEDAPLSPIYQAFTIGRARVIVTDQRSERSPRSLPAPRRTMLGTVQLDWLEKQLQDAATSPLVIWANGVPWITKGNEASKEGWAPYAAERERIANAIVRAGLTRRLVMLSGDAHSLALDDGTNSQYATGTATGSRGFVVAHAAPMDQRTTVKGGPYSHGIVKGNGQFGILDVEDDGSRMRVKIQGRRGFLPVSSMHLEFET
jgi:phosphodiesterase/alkaline phosphatase D-like protein